VEIPLPGVVEVLTGVLLIALLEAGFQPGNPTGKPPGYVERQ
jgi:hypothetical protein